MSEYQWIMNESGLPWLKLDIEVPYQRIYQEVSRFENTNYRAIQGDSGYEQLIGESVITGWDGFALRGLGPDKPSPYTTYGYKNEDDAPYDWTEISEKCSFTKNYLIDQFPSKKYYRIKVNILEPGGQLSPHTDSDVRGLGISAPSPHKIRKVLFAIYWPKEVIFNVGDAQLPIKNGEAYLLDFSYFHSVYNHSKENRYLMGLSADFNDIDSWEQLVVRSYKKFGESVPRF